MKYEKLIFIYPFSIGSFLNAKIGMEATLEEGDDVNECFDKLSKDVKLLADKERGVVNDVEWQKFNGLQVIGHQSPEELSGTFTIQHKQEEPEPIGVTAAKIKSCSDLKILETYRFIKDKNEELKAAYVERYSELSNQSK